MAGANKLNSKKQIKQLFQQIQMLIKMLNNFVCKYLENESVSFLSFSNMEG